MWCAMTEIDSGMYKAVINDEGQYSIWPFDWPNPTGWRDAGKTGRKQDVLSYIETVWTDQRPLVVRLENGKRL